MDLDIAILYGEVEGSVTHNAGGCLVALWRKRAGAGERDAHFVRG